MKVKIKLRRSGKRYESLSCRCCSRVHFKEYELDKQQLKELLEETNSL